MEIKNLQINDIKEYPGNNRINNDTVEALVKIYQKVGFNVPIVVDQNNVIIKGHARYKAAKKAGFETIPCIISTNTDEVNDKDRILDNKISELSRWDKEKLIYEMDGLEIELADLGLAFKNLKPVTVEFTHQDIELATTEQFYEDDSPTAMVSFVCPKCGGYFEYRAKTN